jgi:DNA-binding transcriptional MerR regulator
MGKTRDFEKISYCAIITVDINADKAYIWDMNFLEVRTELERHRGRTDIKLDELVEIANHLISLVVPEQPSDRVTKILNERTLRYYIAEGLIDRPLGKEGTAALYGYRHLLQILAIKLLQGNFLPIRRIREILANKSNEEMEMILAEGLEGPVTNLRPAFRQPLGDLPLARMATPSRRRLLLQEPEVPWRANSLEPTPSLLMEMAEMKTPSPIKNTWERFVLGDGIELHVRTDRKGELRTSEIRRMVERLLQSLKGK